MNKEDFCSLKPGDTARRFGTTFVVLNNTGSVIEIESTKTHNKYVVSYHNTFFQEECQLVRRLSPTDDN